MCRRLIAKANENGGEDNITALVIRIDEQDEAELPHSATIGPPADSQQVSIGDRSTVPAVSASRSEKS
jgi:protein phosphatase